MQLQREPRSRKIGTQAWIAFYTRGLEGYTEWRRLDYPILELVPRQLPLTDEIPKRFTYPVNEQTLNKANYTSAASAIGGDLISTKIFWDKFGDLASVEMQNVLLVN